MILYKNTFLMSLRVLFGRLLTRRIHFSKEHLAKVLLIEDGRRFQIIRHLRVDPKESPEKSVAVFKVHFKFSGLPLSVNKRLSMIPALFLMAKPGFHQKIRTINEEGYFQGLYQWATKDFAEAYPSSFILGLITKRSAESTLSYEVIPDTVLSHYVKKLII